MKIISGGQTGVDLAALDAAVRCGLLTGGFMPPGFRNEDGYFPEFAKTYGLTEGEAPGYLSRTEMNVRQSDFVLIISPKNSPGSIATANLALKLRVGYKMIKYAKLSVDNKKLVADIAAIINYKKPKVLMVAGNRESVCPGIYEKSLPFLIEVFNCVASCASR